MYLTSVTQRDRLFQLVMRWLAGRLESGDGRFVTQVFVYESVIWAPTIRRFVYDILACTYPGPLRLRRLRSKDDLRAALAAAYGDLNDRARDLLGQFRRHPEEFFPGTPADLVIAACEEGPPRAMVRVKRERRIAEKASRRIADGLADRIQAEARALAAGRAAEAGVPLEYLVSSPDAMLDDFARAEQVVSRAFRDEAPTFEPRDLRVDDVIGAKFVGSRPELERIERAISDHPLAAGVEREEHRGRYNDVNLLVDLVLPSAGEIIDAARSHEWGHASRRGLAAEELRREFPGYVESGARTVRAEVILTTGGELIESEFGRSIHEQRILEQRASVPYSGRIASNASFLIEYLLMLAISPTVEVDRLPVKMWGRYLPDIFALAVWDLFGIRPGLELVHAFADAAEALLDPGRSTP
ncbi:MAG: hypothetical protein HZB55_00355 [Deltaproteobacteria bacterium]|nr:hypothetical protein [Deltaproteobacteria bacterium]